MPNPLNDDDYDGNDEQIQDLKDALNAALDLIDGITLRLELAAGGPIPSLVEKRAKLRADHHLDEWSE
jgi:hypothetical protein